MPGVVNHPRPWSAARGTVHEQASDAPAQRPGWRRARRARSVTRPVVVAGDGGTGGDSKTDGWSSATAVERSGPRVSSVAPLTSTREGGVQQHGSSWLPGIAGLATASASASASSLVLCQVPPLTRSPGQQDRRRDLRYPLRKWPACRRSAAACRPATGPRVPSMVVGIGGSAISMGRVCPPYPGQRRLPGGTASRALRGPGGRQPIPPGQNVTSGDRALPAGT